MPPENYDDTWDLARDALNRMARADRRKTGCYLTAEMIECLGRSRIGAYWYQDDLRKAKSPKSK